MKKILPKLLFLGLVVAIVLVGKHWIDVKTYDYRDEVNKSLTNYFINGNTKELNPIIDLLNEYQDDEEYRKEVQSYSAQIVGNWFVYIDNKYVCTLSNKNSCTVQFTEFVALLTKLETLYKCKAQDGYTIIVPSTYNSLKEQTTEKITLLQKAVANSNAKNPSNIEQIRVKKCQLATECENCRNDACVCYYTDSKTNTREKLTCWGKVATNK